MRTDERTGIFEMSEKTNSNFSQLFREKAYKRFKCLIPKHFLPLTIFLLTKQDLHYKFL